MLVKPTVELLDPSWQTVVRDSLITLAETGVLLKQIDLDQKAILGQFGDTGEEAEKKLAKEIVELRVRHGVLRGLHDLGLQFKRDKK